VKVDTVNPFSSFSDAISSLSKYWGLTLTNVVDTWVHSMMGDEYAIIQENPIYSFVLLIFKIIDWILNLSLLVGIIMIFTSIFPFVSSK